MAEAREAAISLKVFVSSTFIFQNHVSFVREWTGSAFYGGICSQGFNKFAERSRMLHFNHGMIIISDCFLDMLDSVFDTEIPMEAVTLVSCLCYSGIFGWFIFSCHKVLHFISQNVTVKKINGILWGQGGGR